MMAVELFCRIANSQRMKCSPPHQKSYYATKKHFVTELDAPFTLKRKMWGILGIGEFGFEADMLFALERAISLSGRYPGLRLSLLSAPSQPRGPVALCRFRSSDQRGVGGSKESFPFWINMKRRKGRRSQLRGSDGFSPSSLPWEVTRS